MTRLAWVVGGTGGIGAACARGLADDGFDVHASDRPEEDATAPDVAAAVAARLSASRTIDGAVHAIGMSGRRLGDGPVSSCTDEAWEAVMQVNLRSAFFFLRACLNHCAPGSSVVLIGSALAKGLDGDFLTAAYRVAKAGMTPLMEAAAYEGARRGIRINMVAPGLVDTPMAARALGTAAITDRFPDLMPLGRRPSTSDEVANAVRWLLSDASAQTTGAVIPVDGGWLLR